LETQDRHKVEKIFSGKIINYQVDPKLLAGVKITGLNFSYELSLDCTLEGALRHLRTL
jgi:F0F1-type ATP synthase delta subunit